VDFGFILFTGSSQCLVTSRLFVPRPFFKTRSLEQGIQTAKKMNFQFNNWIAAIVFWCVLLGSFYFTYTMARKTNRNYLRAILKSFAISFVTCAILIQCVNITTDEAKPYVFILLPFYFLCFYIFSNKAPAKMRGNNLSNEDKKALFKEQANHWLKAGQSMKDDKTITP
jgi:hypothetical protein